MFGHKAVLDGFWTACGRLVASQGLVATSVIIYACQFSEGHEARGCSDVKGTVHNHHDFFLTFIIAWLFVLLFVFLGIGLSTHYLACGLPEHCKFSAHTLTPPDSCLFA